MLKTAHRSQVAVPLPCVGHTASIDKMRSQSPGVGSPDSVIEFLLPPVVDDSQDQRESTRTTIKVHDLPMDNLVESLSCHLRWTEIAIAASACRVLRRATRHSAGVAQSAFCTFVSWRATARATRTAWQSFCMWRDEASRLAHESYDEHMLEELEALMIQDDQAAVSDEEDIFLTDEEADFLADNMMKNSWERLVDNIKACL